MVMLLTKNVMVKWNPNNKEWYEGKGYIFTKWKDEFEVKVEDLILSSKINIITLCDYCLEQNIITICEPTYFSYLRSKTNVVTKDCCMGCRKLKVKESNLLKYNWVNVFQLEKVKIKSKNTLQQNYGVDVPLHNSDIREKARVTNNTKYGFDHSASNLLVQEKNKKTNLERYGVEHYTQTDEYNIKTKATCVEKYGVEHSSQDEKVKEKSRKTKILRYGVEYYSQTNECKEKCIETSLKNWGTEYPMQNEEIKAKVAKTLYNNGTCPTSSQQLVIYNLLKENNYIVELNYPLSRMNLDVAIFIDDIKIDLEYDCAHWHKDQQKDRRRDEFTKSQGWKILRIKSSHKIPKLEQLQEAINKLINSDRKFTQIILDDWKVEEVI